MTKFAAFEKISEIIFSYTDKSKLSNGAQTGINLGSGLLAGFCAAIVSQPADTMLSKINKTQGAPGEGTVSRLIKIAGELGFRGSFAGLPTRLFMVGGLTAGQFAIYGDIKKALGKYWIKSRPVCLLVECWLTKFLSYYRCNQRCRARQVNSPVHIYTT